MSVFKGSCLCGGVQFEVDGPVAGVGQCHCALCRKASGSNGNAVFMVNCENFRWLKREGETVTYALATGWSVARCRTCGSPLPQSHDGKRMWVTAGLMDEPIGTDTRIHIFCGSRADWDRPADDVQHFNEAPGSHDYEDAPDTPPLIVKKAKA